MKPYMPSSPEISEDLVEKRQQLRYVTQNLEATHGIPENTHRDDPLDELIATILSQSTSDVNSQRAFASLKQRFPDWDSVRKARPATIARAIQSGGLANVKSVVIKNLLHEIQKRRGNLNLYFLKTVPLEEARGFLTSLKGVGPKTAACVLLFSCHRDLFPMDTHIFRIAQRMGLVSPHWSDQRAHAEMEPLIPHHKHYSLHVNLIRHGRLVCRPRNPRCEECSLVEHCDWGRARL
jgi:endonuclease-3